MTLLSAPANILIAGEYAVTRPGGVGIALAVGPRATVRIEDAMHTPESARAFRRALHHASRSATPAIPGLEVRTVPEGVAGARTSIVPPVLREIADFTADRDDATRENGAPPPSTTVTIDTSPFFEPRTGRKRGLGSSAVAVVLLTAAVLHLSGINPLRHREALLRIAVRAHRMFQGGRGSGYDVTSSILGGAIRFVGGEPPRWDQLDLVDRWEAEGVRMMTWSGPSPVASSPAVEAFDRRYPPGSDADALINRFNTLVHTLAEADSWTAFTAALQAARELGQVIGREIGVPAELPGNITASITKALDGRNADWTAKPVGAGDEQAVVFLRGYDPDEIQKLATRGFSELLPERDGLRREEVPLG